jgi:hypothetical protein
MIEVASQRTLDDLVDAQSQMMSRSKRYLRQAILGWLCIVALFLGIGTGAYFIATFSGPKWFYIVSVMGFGYGFIFLLMPLYRPAIFRRPDPIGVKAMLKELGTGGSVGEVVMRLSDNSYSETLDDCKIEVPWAKVDRIETISDKTFLFLSPIYLVTLRRKNFAAEDEYEKVVAFAKERFAHFHGPQ